MVAERKRRHIRGLFSQLDVHGRPPVLLLHDVMMEMACSCSCYLMTPFLRKASCVASNQDLTRLTPETPASACAASSSCPLGNTRCSLSWTTSLWSCRGSHKTQIQRKATPQTPRSMHFPTAQCSGCGIKTTHVVIPKPKTIKQACLQVPGSWLRPWAPA